MNYGLIEINNVYCVLYLIISREMHSLPKTGIEPIY